jgi:hypothetical protein
MMPIFGKTIFEGNEIKSILTRRALKNSSFKAQKTASL